MFQFVEGLGIARKGGEFICSFEYDERRNPATVLPVELMMEVFSYLGTLDWLSCGSVSREWKVISSNPHCCERIASQLGMIPVDSLRKIYGNDTEYSKMRLKRVVRSCLTAQWIAQNKEINIQHFPVTKDFYKESIDELDRLIGNSTLKLNAYKNDLSLIRAYKGLVKDPGALSSLLLYLVELRHSYGWIRISEGGKTVRYRVPRNPLFEQFIEDLVLAGALPPSNSKLSYRNDFFFEALLTLNVSQQVAQAVLFAAPKHCTLKIWSLFEVCSQGYETQFLIKLFNFVVEFKVDYGVIAFALSSQCPKEVVEALRKHVHVDSAAVDNLIRQHRLEQKAQEYSESGHLEKALDLYSRLGSIPKTFGWKDHNLILRAELLLKMRLYSEALSLLSGALGSELSPDAARSTPEYKRAVLLSGISNLQMNEIPSAKKAFLLLMDTIRFEINSPTALNVAYFFCECVKAEPDEQQIILLFEFIMNLLVTHPRINSYFESLYESCVELFPHFSPANKRCVRLISHFRDYFIENGSRLGGLKATATLIKLLKTLNLQGEVVSEEQNYAIIKQAAHCEDLPALVHPDPDGCELSYFFEKSSEPKKTCRINFGEVGYIPGFRAFDTAFEKLKDRGFVIPCSNYAKNIYLSAFPLSITKKDFKDYREIFRVKGPYYRGFPREESEMLPELERICEFTSFYPRQALGFRAWQHLGDVGHEPQLPYNIRNILSTPCPCEAGLNEFGRTIGDAFIPVLIPSHINGDPLTIKLFKNLLQSHSRQFKHWAVGEAVENKKITKSYWVLISKGHIKGSINARFSQQDAVVKSLGPQFRPPKITEALYGLYLYYAVHGETPYTRSNNYTAHPKDVWTRCIELFEGDKRLACCGFSKDGGIKRGDGAFREVGMRAVWELDSS